jgi:hypothetical protein
MIRKIKLKLISIFHRFAEKLSTEFNAEEHEKRLSQLRILFHEILPKIDEKWEGKAIIEGGRFNYFTLPSGQLPKYDFALPEIPLYVIVANIASADWEQAKLRGVGREQWEQYNYELSFVEEATPKLATIGLAAVPRIIVIRWNDPINHFSIAEKLQEVSR